MHNLGSFCYILSHVLVSSLLIDYDCPLQCKTAYYCYGNQSGHKRAVSLRFEFAFVKGSNNNRWRQHSARYLTENNNKHRIIYRNKLSTSHGRRRQSEHSVQTSISWNRGWYEDKIRIPLSLPHIRRKMDQQNREDKILTFSITPPQPADGWSTGRWCSQGHVVRRKVVYSLKSKRTAQ